ncbi:MAG: LysE family translocator [Gammaproteobacteria bacterium]|nr:LysE family translocator [Gammaproteobacteria bacterium]
MTIELWVSFIGASMILCFSPGPTVFLVMGQALAHGKRSVVPLVAGALAGDLIAMGFSFIGIGVLLATSAALFTLLKWVGALYLIYLGLKAWRSKATINPPRRLKRSSVFFNALIVTALNPKGIIFFLAFFPLFINANAPLLPQMAILVGSFLAVSTVSVSFYATSSAALRHRVSSINFQNSFNKVSGGMLIGAGAITASIEHNG